MKDIILTGKQIEEFRDALISAFYTSNLLQQMLHFQLNKRLFNIVSSGPLKKIAYELIIDAEANGWLYMLLIGARKQNTGNEALKTFEQNIGLATRHIHRHSLEAKIRTFDQFISLNEWLPKLHQIEKQVCKIELPKGGSGTGFLVSSDIILTNYHVVSDLIEGHYSYKDVSMRFDYKKIRSQSEGLDGEVFQLAENWYIGHSPMSKKDAPFNIEAPSLDELDYALIRLEKPINSRNFIQLPDITSNSFLQNYDKNRPLFIVQHPNGEPIKLTVDVEGVIGLNTNGTRLNYKTLTESGSSGSPCFNQDLELIALHHNGFEGSRNVGIPIHTLMKDWKKKNFISIGYKWLV